MTASDEQRVRFYGATDYATHWQVEEAAAVLSAFDPENRPSRASDFIELHNAQQFVVAGFLPSAHSVARRLSLEEMAWMIRSAVAQFFTGINNSNVGDSIESVPVEYHTDLLDLLGNNRVYERCDAKHLLKALASTGVQIGAMLTNKKLVQAYDADIRDSLVRDALGGHYLMQSFFGASRRTETFIPRSLTAEDSHELLERYIDSPDANPNSLSLIMNAPINSERGIDAKLKLRAKRRKAEATKALFKDNAGFKYGCAVGISNSQEEPVKVRFDEETTHYTYGEAWLNRTSDAPSVLNNFQHLFAFANRSSLLTLPSYPAEFGVISRLISSSSRTDYRIGTAYHAKDMLSTLQTQLLHGYLGSMDLDLEAIISWFFESYLVEEFNAGGFSFASSSNGTTYLEKSRHLFVEMESAVRQFTLLAEDGEIDRELLTLSSETVSYKQIPSLLPGKYVYATDHPDVTSVLHLLFSDQSSLAYVSEELSAPRAAELFALGRVSYEDFANFQKSSIDRLLELSVLTNTDDRLQIANWEQFLILQSLFDVEAESYYHLSASGRSVADSMIAEGWLQRASTLLTAAEASYFSFHLNKAEFRNGPELRNKYLHGVQANLDGEKAHYDTYTAALKLTIALVIKMNDEFCLLAEENEISTSAPDAGVGGTPAE